MIRDTRFIAARSGLAVIALLLALGNAQSQGSKTESEDCSGANSTMEIVQCLSRLAAAWDRRLNAAYREQMSTLEPPRAELLRTAQRLWIQYRDANCEWYAAGEGTISRVEAAECMRSMTERRARELEGEQN